MKGCPLNGRQRQRLMEQAKRTSQARVYRRTLALLEVNRGQSIAQIAEALGVTRQSVYNWIVRYRQVHDPRCLEDAERSGRPSVWTEERRSLLRALLDHAPEAFGYFDADWTVPLLQEQFEHHLDARLSDDTIRRGLAALGYVWKRGRYELQPDPALEKKTLHSPSSSASGAPECPAGRR